MQTRSALVMALAALATAILAIVVLDIGVPSGTSLLAPQQWIAATTGGSGADAPPRKPSVHDIHTPLAKIAFGSCNDQSMEQPLWQNIAKHEPELWLWMGDNVRVCACTTELLTSNGSRADALELVLVC